MNETSDRLSLCIYLSLIAKLFKPIYYEKEIENAERTLRILIEYQGVSNERIKTLNGLTNGD